MNLDDAAKLCPLLSAMTAHGYENWHLLDALRLTFPEIPWRLILDRSGDYTRWRFTVLADDPSEHYIERSSDEPSGRCMHCGKTGKELNLTIREDD